MPPLVLVAPDKQVRMAYLVVLSSCKVTRWSLGGSCRQHPTIALWGMNPVQGGAVGHLV